MGMGIGDQRIVMANVGKRDLNFGDDDDMVMRQGNTLATRGCLR